MKLFLLITNNEKSEYYAIYVDTPLTWVFPNYVYTNVEILGGYQISVHIENGEYTDTRYGVAVDRDIAIPGETVVISMHGYNDGVLELLEVSCPYISLTPTSIMFVMPAADVSINARFTQKAYQLQPVTVTVTYTDPDSGQELHTYFTVGVITEAES